MRSLGFLAVALVVVGLGSMATGQVFSEDFEAYAAGSEIHGQGGWKGWDNTASAGAPTSGVYFYSGAISVEIGGATDLVHEFDVTGGRWVMKAMQYIPSGTTGNNFFILLNTYADGGAGNDWSVQWNMDLAAGTINLELGSGSAKIVYDQWVELKFIIDLDGNTIEEYYNGELISTSVWDDNDHDTIGAIDLYGNSASPVYYDDITIEEYVIYNAQAPNPADGEEGVVNALLRWTAGDTAAMHNVYLGTSAELTEADLVAPQQLFTMYFHMDGLEPGTTYYWRVDEIEADGTTTHQGDLWTFSAAPQTAYSPSPRDGDKWIDSETGLSWVAGQGATSHALYFGTDAEAVANRDAGVFVDDLPLPSHDPDALEAGTTYYWAVDESDGTNTYAGEVWSFTIADGKGGIKGEYFGSMTPGGEAGLTRIDPDVDFSWGNDGPGDPIAADNFSARWTADLEIAVADTYTFITRTDDGARLWLDGEMIVNRWVDQGPTDAFSRPLDLEPGFYALQMEYYENGGGATAQLAWQTPSVARQIIPAGPLQPPARAKFPYPASGDVNTPQDPTLRWTAGDEAAQHQIYFGEDKDAVANATPADGGIYRGQQALEATTYAVSGLEWNKTYYWRVDEVNPANPDSPWKGGVWKFTTADFIVVDDFEAYTNDVGTRAFEAWIDGVGFTLPEPGNPGNGTGAAVGHDIWNAGSPHYNGQIMETLLVKGGGQSLPLYYDNTASPYLSEAQRTWTMPQDWTSNGAETLVLYVRGIPTNVAEPVYVVIEDSLGQTAVVTQANPEAALATQWLEWEIALSDLADAGVNPAAVKKMTLGLGNQAAPTPGAAGVLYVDEIRVVKPAQ